MIKLGVVGAGNMGKNHIRVALSNNDYFEFVGFYDKSSKCRKEVSKTYNVEAFSKLDELFKKVDACIIAVPSSLHLEVGLLAAKYNLHVLMEKPLCLNSKDANILAKNFKNKVLMTGHVERYNPVVTALSNIIKKEEVIAIEARRCSPYDKRIFDTSVVMDLMIHDADIILNSLVNKDYTEVYALGNNKFSKENLDYVNAIIKFDDDITCSITSSRSTEEKIRTINVHTKRAYFIADLLNKTLKITHRTECKYDEFYNYKQDNLVETVFLPFLEPLKEEQKEFYYSIKEKREALTNAKDAIKTIELLEKIEKKAGK